jgi:hypothetical protein
VCVRTESGTLGFASLPDAEPSRSQILSAECFLKRYSQSKVIFVHLGREWKKFSDRILIAPISAL